MRGACWMVCVSVASVGCVVPGVRAGAEPPPAESSPLSGPKVEPQAARPTLVERNFDGTVKRLEIAPAEAAVQKLALDEATRAKVEAIIAERAAMLDGIVRENLKTLIDGALARQAGDQQAAADALRALAREARPLRERGMIGREFAQVLPPEQAAEMDRMVREYWQAVLAEPAGEAGAMDEAKPEPEAPRARRGGAGAGGGGGRGGVGGAGANQRRIAEESMRVVGAELRRSYDRVVGSQVRELEDFLRAVNATPEQEGKIRQITGDLFQQSYGKATPAERAEMFMKVYAVLTPEQREIVRQRVREQRGG